MCEKFTVWCQKGAFAGGRGAVSTKRAPSWVKGALCARRTALLAGGTPYPLTRALSWAKMGTFSAKRAPSLAEGASYLLKWIIRPFELKEIYLFYYLIDAGEFSYSNDMH